MEGILFIASILVMFSVVASKATGKLGVPALLIFLFIGMAAGPGGPLKLNIISHESSALIGIIALVYILFSGGLDTKWTNIKPVLAPGIVLSTLGVAITAGVLGIIASFVFKISILQGLLLGSIVSSTDAAAVFSILRSKGVQLNEKLRSLLELESGSNDPMAVFLTTGIIGLLLNEVQGPGSLVVSFFIQMGAGAIIGFAAGKAVVYLINKIDLDYEGLYPVLTTALIIFVYAVSTKIGANAFLAVYICGIVLNNSQVLHKKTIIRFHEGLAWMMQIAMFLVLGLMISPAELLKVSKEGIIIAFVLIFAARPLAVFISLLPFKISAKEKVFTSWVGLRGAVPIILAVFPLVSGIENAYIMFHVVFYTVLISALLQGSSVPVVAKKFGLESDGPVATRYPIEFEQFAGIDADMHEVMVPFGSFYTGKKLFELNIPTGSLVALIARGKGFVIPNGSTELEDGDVMLVMAEKSAVKEIESKLSQKKTEVNNEEEK